MAQQLKRYEQLLQGMINAVVSRTDLSDITDASAIKHVLAAVARELDEFYFQLAAIDDKFSIDTAVGQDLDDRAADIQPSIIAREQAAKAVGTVIFSRAGTSGVVNIPAGTIVKTSSGLEFQTTAIATIANTFQDAPPVAAIAVVAGASGNVAANTIIRFGSKPVGVDSVNNGVTFTAGADKETDDAFRARIRLFVRSLARSTPEALEFVSRTVRLSTGQRVVFSHVFEDPINLGEVILYIDDGAGTAESVAAVVGEDITGGGAVGGEEFLGTANKPIRTADAITVTSSVRGLLVDGTDYTLDDAAGMFYFTPALVAAETITVSYTAYTGLIEEVQKVIDGDPLDEANYPGWRAAGVRVRVRTPAIIQQIVELSLTIAVGYDETETEDAVTTAISSYINNLGISGDVLLAELIDAIMGVPGVYNCSLLLPSNDVVILDAELARVTASNITIY